MWTGEPSVKNDQTHNTSAVHPVSPPLPVEERRVVAWVGKSVIFTGTLVSSEDMTIDGQVEGSIDVRDHGLTVGPDADIRADVVARTVTIHGTVTGNIRASAKVDIRPTGRVEGNLLTPRIVIADGAVVRGQVDTSAEQSGPTTLRAQFAIA